MRDSRPDRRARAALLALLALLAPLPARAGDALPARAQASLFRRVFSYDPALRGKPGLKVLVLHGRLSIERAREVAAAFEAEGVAAATSEVEVPPSYVDDATVLYVLPDVPAAALAELSHGRGLLTISGDPEAVERGRVAVALRRRPQGQPEILVHLPRLLTDGHELSSRLLKLATVLP